MKKNPQDATMRNVRAANKRDALVQSVLEDFDCRLKVVEKKLGIKKTSSRMPKEVRDLLGGDTDLPDS